jgi:hypothetical protein
MTLTVASPVEKRNIFLPRTKHPDHGPRKSSLCISAFILARAYTLVAIFACCAAAAMAQSGAIVRSDEILLRNGLLSIHYHRQAGVMDIEWKDGHKLLGVTSEAQLADGRSLTSDAYAHHILEAAPSRSATSDTVGAAAHEYTIRNTDPEKPALLQHIWIYDGKPWIAIEAELSPEAGVIGTRHFDTVVLKNPDAVRLKQNAALRILHVPFDNDMWFRFDSKAVAEIKPGQTFTGEEVTAIYDNGKRDGIVLGSIAHNTWKTAIEAQASDGHLSNLKIYGGISSPTGIRTDTHDTIPHGLVHGARVVSPTTFVGSFSDWRDGMETYGAINAAIHPPLPWAADPPMGWNSWAAYQDKINERRTLEAATFLRNTLVPLGYGRSNVLYVNLDAFWTNLDAVQLADEVATIHNMRGKDGTRFEPGIYWTPFAYWSDDFDAFVEGTGMKYRYRDILLRAPDGSVLPKLDGGWPIDPTHPGAKARTAFYLQHFEQLGFQYLKIDFLSHGALEGVHYDPAIQTGTEAYNLGMKQIADTVGTHMFLSLSIAPLFPSGYGHARRLSCDTKGHIDGAEQSTEYMLNSLTYGWWTNHNLYITDPDHVVLGEKADQGARSITEGKSRLLSAVIAGGMILDSSALSDDPQGRAFAHDVYDNRALFALAREGKSFRPIEGDTGTRAANAFLLPSADGIYLAVFNYDAKQAQTITIPLNRIDASLASAKEVSVVNVATKQALPSAYGAVTVTLLPAESKLLELRAARKD